MMYLVDSTAYIDWIRAGRNPIRILGPWIRAGSLVGCGIVRVEVLRGIVAEPVRQEMKLLFGHIPDVPCTPDVFDEAADLAWSLDREGRVLPLTDVIIAVCARRAQATLVTRDKHYRQIPDVKTIPDLPG
jgi:predicted nucleic acid-binding protein